MDDKYFKNGGLGLSIVSFVFLMTVMADTFGLVEMKIFEGRLMLMMICLFTMLFSWNVYSKFK